MNSPDRAALDHAQAALDYAKAAPDTRNAAAPAKIGNYPLNDPDGLYYGQALAGFGMMWNTRYLAANKLPAPK